MRADATISMDILASKKENYCKGSFDGAGNKESAWCSHGLMIRRAYLFNVIMIKSPRSGPQYIASCSPPQSNILSSETIARKQTWRRFRERTEGRRRVMTYVQT